MHCVNDEHIRYVWRLKLILMKMLNILSVSSAVILYNTGRHLYSSLFGGEEGVIDCSRLFDEEVSDGRDMLQYATYEIIQGPHQGKKILACKCPWSQAPLKQRPGQKLTVLISPTQYTFFSYGDGLYQLRAGFGR